jgi:uncharacterized membrane protein YdjX (TVP38/TMEM64 family)
MPIKKIALAVLIASIVILYFVGGGERYLDIDMYQDLYARSPVGTAAVFFVIFFIGIACSLPIAGAMTVISGMIFGHLTGFAISVTAATLGGILAVISVRILFHDIIKRRFSAQVDVVNKGVEKDGGYYLFGLRMIPVIPFGLLNLMVGLTSMPVGVFAVATLFGMIPVMLLLTFAGSQLGDIESFSFAAIFSPGIILALALLAVFPFAAKAIVKFSQRIRNPHEES